MIALTCTNNVPITSLSSSLTANRASSRCPGYELALETGEILVHQTIYNAFHPHPSGKNSMQRGMLIRHLNGDASDNRAVNLAECSVYEAMVHIDDWVTDWTCFLTEEEQQFVRENVDTFRKLYARY